MLFAKKILLDTNFLLVPYQFGVDIFGEIERICDFRYKLYVLDKSIGELEGIIKNQKGKTKRAAKFGLALIKAKNINIITTNTDKYVDDIIKEIGYNYIVATNDRELKKHLKRVIVLRQKNHLELID